MVGILNDISATTLLYEMSTIFVTMLRDKSVIIFIEGSMLGILGILGMLGMLELLELLELLDVGEGGPDEVILYYHLILFYLQIKFA
jgi:hypothetical protein